MITLLVAFLLATTPTMPASVSADARGFTAAWTAPTDAVTVCLQRRSWPRAADTPIGCYPAQASVVMRQPRDLNLQIVSGDGYVLTALDNDNAPVAEARGVVGTRMRLWLGLWGG
jgi:hypothetical protein